MAEENGDEKFEINIGPGGSKIENLAMTEDLKNVLYEALQRKLGREPTCSDCGGSEWGVLNSEGTLLGPAYSRMGPEINILDEQNRIIGHRKMSQLDGLLPLFTIICVHCGLTKTYDMSKLIKIKVE